jgi:hypothetical protein
MDSSTNITGVKLDKEGIKQEIFEKGKYEDETLTLKPWKGEIDSEFYIGSIALLNTKYLGVFNQNLKRQSYGVNSYSNGDVYFGHFHNDLKSKHGCYFFAPETLPNGKVHTEIYHGFWKDDKKDHHGIAVWLDEKKGNTDFDLADFDAFVGEFEKDEYRKGTYLTKIDDNYFVYYGYFDSNGKKNDNNALFYTSKQDRMFRGVMKDDKYVSGYFIYFDDEGKITDITYIEMDGDTQVVKHVRKFDKISKDEKEKLKNEATIFRNLLIEEDYFGMIYTKIKEMNDFIIKRFDITNLDDTTNYLKIVKLAGSYNDVKINVRLNKAFPVF